MRAASSAADFDLDEDRPLLPPNQGQEDLSREQDDGFSIDVRSFCVACGANMYEYYDFALLGFFSTEISVALFPSESGASAIIQLYSLYAAGFIARPFGGVVFGFLGDRVGRRASLTASMILMSFPTFLTGCIPPFEVIGYWAPIILLLLRVLQGLSTGGENSSGVIYVYETAPRNRRAFWLSVFAICSSGTLVASLFHVALQHSLSGEQMSTWGWRLPFWFGIGLFIFSLVSRNWLKKTETFARLENSPYVHRNPIKYVCSHNNGVLIKFVMAGALQHASAYMIFVFLPSFLSSDAMRGTLADGWTDPNAYTSNVINAVLYLPVVMVVGYFTDTKGSWRFIATSTCLLFCLSPFLFYALSISDSSVMNWFYQFLLTMSSVPVWGCIYFWYIDALLSDPRTRVTIYGVGYNLGAAVFGGTASLLGTSFVTSLGASNGMIMTGIWMSLCAALCVVCVAYVEFYEKRKISDSGKNLKDRTIDNFTSSWYLNPKYRKALDTILEDHDEEDRLSPEASADSDRRNKSPTLYG